MRKSVLFLFCILSSSLLLSLSSCKKDDDKKEDGTTPSGDFYKGTINSWENGVILRSNGTARYYISFTGGSMSDTANINVSKYEGTYHIVSGNDSIYINCGDTAMDVNFDMKGIMNTAHTSMSGTWKHSQSGITNTLPFTLTK